MVFDTTVKFLDEHDSVWSGRPAFADAVTRVKVAVGAIGGVTGKQQTPITGVAGDKAGCATSSKK